MGSRLFAVKNGWSMRSSYGELSQALLLKMYSTIYFDDKVNVVFPWTDDSPIEAVTEEERIQALAELKKRSAIIFD